MSNELRKQNRSYWDEQARDNAAWHISHSRTDEEFRVSGRVDAQKVFGADFSDLPTPGRVLEIGCGIGRVIEQLCAAAPESQFFGVDVSTEMVHQANERLRGSPHALVFRTGGDGLDMFDDAYFDFVYSLMVFQHLPQATFRAYALEVARVLRPQGTFRFQVQYDADLNGLDPHPADDFRSIRYYDVASLRKILPPSLEVTVHPPHPRSPRVHDYYLTCRRISDR